MDGLKMDQDNLRFINQYSVEVDREWLNAFHVTKSALEAPRGHNWQANQILVFNHGEALGRYLADQDKVKKISGGKRNTIYGVEPRGFEQMAAFDVMLDPDIQLAFVHGIAGSGKTYCACAAGLELIDGALAKGTYDQIILLRPISYVGRSMGLVPGDADEKYANFMAPVMAHLEELAPRAIDSLIREGRITAQPIEYIRGANLKHSIVILDEAQNTGIHEMTTILTRMDQTSKLFVCGDTKQVDERGEMKFRNGLTVAMEHMQNGTDTDVAILEFFKSERKGISRKATERMYGLQ